MRYNLIKYHLTNGNPDEWNREVASFVKAIDEDPSLRGKIAYRALRTEGGDYYHLAVSVDETATKELVSRDFFKQYAEKVEKASAGGVEVLPLEVVAQTAPQP